LQIRHPIMGEEMSEKSGLSPRSGQKTIARCETSGKIVSRAVSPWMGERLNHYRRSAAPPVRNWLLAAPRRFTSGYYLLRLRRIASSRTLLPPANRASLVWTANQLFQQIDLHLLPLYHLLLLLDRVDQNHANAIVFYAFDLAVFVVGDEQPL
jgi:hypothetical protein